MKELIVIAQSLFNEELTKNGLINQFPQLKDSIFCTKELKEVLEKIPEEAQNTKITLITGSYIRPLVLGEKMSPEYIFKKVKERNKNVEIYLFSSYPDKSKIFKDSYQISDNTSTAENIAGLVYFFYKIGIVEKPKDEEKKAEKPISFFKRIWPYIFIILLINISFNGYNQNKDTIKKISKKAKISYEYGSTNYPGCRKDEVFLYIISSVSYAKIDRKGLSTFWIDSKIALYKNFNKVNFKTKRMGEKAYNTIGQFDKNSRPIFIKKWEFNKHEKYRKKN